MGLEDLAEEKVALEKVALEMEAVGGWVVKEDLAGGWVAGVEKGDLEMEVVAVAGWVGSVGSGAKVVREDLEEEEMGVVAKEVEMEEGVGMVEGDYIHRAAQGGAVEPDLVEVGMVKVEEMEGGLAEMVGMGDWEEGQEEMVEAVGGEAEDWVLAGLAEAQAGGLGSEAGDCTHQGAQVVGVDLVGLGSEVDLEVVEQEVG